MKTKKSLLPVAKRLFETAHRINPFMTLNSSQEKGISIVMECHSLKEGQDLYTALVEFFEPGNKDKKQGEVLSSISCPAGCSSGKLLDGKRCNVCAGRGSIEYVIRG